MDVVEILENHEARLRRLTKSLEELVLSGGGGLKVFGSISAFPVPGDPDFIYLDESTGSSYYWDGTQYLPFAGQVQVSNIPDAVLPIMGNEYVVMIQNGVMVKINIYTLFWHFGLTPGNDLIMVNSLPPSPSPSSKMLAINGGTLVTSDGSNLVTS